MKKLILSLALFAGFIFVSNAQTSATGGVPVTKPKPVIETSKPDPVTTGSIIPSEPKPAETTTTTTPTTKKSTKKACCKKKSDGCCKKKTEAIRED